MCPCVLTQILSGRLIPPSDPAKGRSLENISITKHDDDDNDVHDYEYIDVDQLDSIRKTYQEQNVTVGKGKPSNTI